MDVNETVKAIYELADELNKHLSEDGNFDTRASRFVAGVTKAASDYDRNFAHLRSSGFTIPMRGQAQRNPFEEVREKKPPAVRAAAVDAVAAAGDEPPESGTPHKDEYARKYFDKSFAELGDELKGYSPRQLLAYVTIRADEGGIKKGSLLKGVAAIFDVAKSGRQEEVAERIIASLNPKADGQGGGDDDAENQPEPETDSTNEEPKADGQGGGDDDADHNG